MTLLSEKANKSGRVNREMYS